VSGAVGSKLLDWIVDLICYVILEVGCVYLLISMILSPSVSTAYDWLILIITGLVNNYNEEY